MCGNMCMPFLFLCKCSFSWVKISFFHDLITHLLIWSLVVLLKCSFESRLRRIHRHKWWGWPLGYTLGKVHIFKLCLYVLLNPTLLMFFLLIEVRERCYSLTIPLLYRTRLLRHQAKVWTFWCTDAPDIWQPCQCPQTCSLEDYKMLAGPKKCQRASQIPLH